MYLYFLITFMLVVVGVDFYFYYSVRQVIKGGERKKKVPSWLRASYWTYTIFTVLFLCVAIYFYIIQTPPPKFARTYITGFIFIVLLSKLIGIVFFLLDDIKRLLLYVGRKTIPDSTREKLPGKKISRSAFIKQTGIVAAAVPFVSMMYGVVRSAFDYNVINLKVPFNNLPKAFHGFRIVQISDIHTGSFISSSPLEDAVSIINEQNPDAVFFTGDLVNEVAEEALPFVEVFKEISAPHGVYSILGNHDYGDYFYPKGDADGRAHNYALMKGIHNDMGWDILLNENRLLEKDGESIRIIGVENWGDKGRFQKYGDLDMASAGINRDEFRILLSHDPSHWDAVVRQEHAEIDLTLSGHTHGFQMGIEIPGYIKWSPSQYMYDQWAGLYSKSDQSIYVNRGLGFLGYPGRLGILPEITVIELQSTLT
jgi:predicted MPP superfamily phosphohydrolase